MTSAGRDAARSDAAATLRRLVGVVLLVAITAAGCGYEAPALQPVEVDPPVTSAPSSTSASASSAPQSSEPTGPEAARTLVAQAKPGLAEIKVFAQPDDRAPSRTIANPGDYGNTQTFRVREQRSSWLLAELPVRPNGSEGWIRARDVVLTQHDYRIVVELSAFRLRLWKAGRLLLDEPIGVGTSDTPTPGGTYFTWVLLDPTTSAYGAYAYGLSGFSEKLSTFAGGDARLGIHGTPDESSIGRNVSRGCIRLHDEALIRMVEEIRLPLGVPVTVLA